MVATNNNLQKTQGFTLVEVVIGMMVFILLIVSGSMAIVQTQKLAHSNIMHNTARTVMEGYMEQMKGISFKEYQEAMKDPDNVPIATKGISSLKTGTDIQYDDPLYLNKENKKEVLLDLLEASDGSLTPLTMSLYVKPTLTDLLPSTGLSIYEVTLEFRYESLFKGVNKEYSKSIRFVKTAVSEY